MAKIFWRILRTVIWITHIKIKILKVESIFLNISYIYIVKKWINFITIQIRPILTKSYILPAKNLKLLIDENIYYMK